MRGWIIGGVATLAVAGAVTAGFVVTSGNGDQAGAAPTARPRRRSWPTVERQDLQRTESFDGKTGHGEAEPLVLAGTGTLTALPKPGDVIEPGATIVEVDGRPIIALQGPLPMWRALGPSVADGKDVLQLEYVLTALGYGETYGVIVDEDWTSATTKAVKAFQEDHGQDDDGTIDVGDIVWIDGPVRVDSVAGAARPAAAEAGIEVTGTDPDRARRPRRLRRRPRLVGHRGHVELPSGETIDGTVASVGSAETGEDGVVDAAGRRSPWPTAPTCPTGCPSTSRSPPSPPTDVLVVPVEARARPGRRRLRRRGVRRRRRRRTSCAVDLGVFADDLVAVTGDVTAGDQVVVP